MALNPKLNLDAYEASFKAIDTHTVGEFTRVLFSGFPKLEGNRLRDVKNQEKLVQMGWKVLILWECMLKDKIFLQEKIRCFLTDGEE